VRAASNISWKRVEIALGVLLTGLLVFLHIFRCFHAGPLWRDEISSLTLATRPTWSGFWDTLVFDPFPALFFVLLRAWHGLVGDSDFTLRWLGTLIGLAVVFAFWLAARLTHRRVPLITLILIGFSPTLIIWGDTLRSYGLGVFWIITTFGCFWQLVERPRLSEMALATLTATLSVQSLFTNAFLVLALGLAAASVGLVRRSPKTALFALVAGAIAALSLVIYVPTILATREWSWLNHADVSVSQHLRVWQQAIDARGGNSIYLWFFALAMAIALSGIQLIRQRTCQNRKPLFERDLVLFSFVTLLIACSASLAFFSLVGWRSNIWYFLPAMAITAVAIETMLLAVGEGWIQVLGRTLVAAVVIAFFLPDVYHSLRARNSNLDLVANTIAQSARTNDRVIIYPSFYGITFQRYFRGNTNWMTVPPVSDHTLHNWRETAEQVRKPEPIKPVLDQVEQTLKMNGRVWLVIGLRLSPQHGPPPNVPPRSRAGDNRALGTFLVGWSNLLVYDLDSHARTIRGIPVASPDAINLYEGAALFLVEGNSPSTAAR
jgi:hypothetical protein